MGSWLDSLPAAVRRLIPPAARRPSAATPTRPPSDPHPRFDLFGGVAAGFNCRAREVLLAGPAGTGKTLANLLRLYWCCVKYPGVRGLMIRKTRESLTDSMLVTWEGKVLGPAHPVLARPILRRVRQSYRFGNGSEVVVGGIDKPGKVLSSEYDLILVNEATDLSLADWETLAGRLRAGAMPYDQILGDCNPTSPTHWLYRRCQEAGGRKTTLVPTTHRDNPHFWDRAAGDWTPAGRRYVVGRLGDLTGVQRKRFLLGLWEQAEGLVLDPWDAATHVIDPFPVPPSWPRYLSIDFGFTNPFCCQWWAEDPDDRLYLYREIYRSKALVEDHAAVIAAHMESEPAPAAVVCDPADAEGRATLERHLGIVTAAAKKDAVTAGVQEACERLRPVADRPGRDRRLYLFRDARCHPADPLLLEAGKPTCTADEVGAWVYDADAKGGDRPVDRDNHGCDALRYLCKHLAGRAESGLLGYHDQPPTAAAAGPDPYA